MSDLVATAGDEVGESVVDVYTPVHFGVGIAAGAVGVSPRIFTLASIGGRATLLALKEGFKDAFLTSLPGQSPANQMTDILVEILGLYVGQAIRGQLLPGSSTAGLGGKIVGFSEKPGKAPPASGVLVGAPAVAPAASRI